MGGALVRQPRHRAEALSTARALQAGGWNFSVGLGQINVGNFARLGLTLESAFEPCTNLAAMQTVLGDCFDRASASASTSVDQVALRQALPPAVAPKLEMPTEPSRPEDHQHPGGPQPPEPAKL